MADKKTFNINISNLSGRRKLAVLVALVLFGAGLSDPVFLGDIDVSVSTRDANTSTDDFAEIETMLAEFEANKNTEENAELPSNSQLPPADEELAENKQPSFLTIPQTDESHRIVRSVSYPDTTEAQSPVYVSADVDHEHRSTAPPQHSEAVAQSSHVQPPTPATANIRFTGSIVTTP